MLIFHKHTAEITIISNTYEKVGLCYGENGQIYQKAEVGRYSLITGEWKNFPSTVKELGLFLSICVGMCAFPLKTVWKIMKYKSMKLSHKYFLSQFVMQNFFSNDSVIRIDVKEW